MFHATLRLFNAIQVDKKSQHDHSGIMERTIRNGYWLDSSIPANKAVLGEIEELIGISGEKANASFHKSWKVVRDASMETLVLQQIIHYLTTYGAEALGIYDEGMVYIPNEVLKLPKFEAKLPVVFIKALTKEEVLDRIIKLGSGIAISEESLKDIMRIVNANEYDKAFINKIKNRELLGLLHDFYHIVPSDPVEYLRYVVAKLTDESLLIKNSKLIAKIKQADGKFLAMLLKDAPNNLASIFLRYKPLFLAMKSIAKTKKTKRFFNQLRKKAKKQHKPLPEDYLNNITCHIKKGTLDKARLAKKLQKATLFRKIRLAAALRYRCAVSHSIVYRVRNGSGWATEFDWETGHIAETGAALSIVTASIARDLEHLQDKTVYIPAHVGYTLPASEKQFTGNFPSGTWVEVSDDLIVGIHWTDTKRRIDLDLSVISPSGKLGWDSQYRTQQRDVLFSGDVTAAPKPKGATELFYIKSKVPETRLLIVNYYNYQNDDPVDCRILVAKETPKVFGHNYMINPDNIIMVTNTVISKKQTILGLLTSVKGQNRVYFYTVGVGNSITSSSNKTSGHTLQYLTLTMLNALELREVLALAGANVVDEPPESGEFINLSPANLTKDSLLRLLTPEPINVL